MPRSHTQGEIVTFRIDPELKQELIKLADQDQKSLGELFDSLPSVTVLPLTSELRDAPILRITIRPQSDNGLQKPSQIMIDKVITVPRARLGKRIGRLDSGAMQSVNTA